MQRPVVDDQVPGIIGRKHLQGGLDRIGLRRVEQYRLVDLGHHGGTDALQPGRVAVDLNEFRLRFIIGADGGEVLLLADVEGEPPDQFVMGNSLNARLDRAIVSSGTCAERSEAMPAFATVEPVHLTGSAAKSRSYVRTCEESFPRVSG
jgi:hypothetical protein